VTLDHRLAAADQAAVVGHVIRIEGERLAIGQGVTVGPGVAGPGPQRPDRLVVCGMWGIVLGHRPSLSDGSFVLPWNTIPRAFCALNVRDPPVHLDPGSPRPTESAGDDPDGRSAGTLADPSLELDGPR
jgi:hypothetical protein